MGLGECSGASDTRCLCVTRKILSRGRNNVRLLEMPKFSLFFNEIHWILIELYSLKSLLNIHLICVLALRGTVLSRD